MAPVRLILGTAQLRTRYGVASSGRPMSSSDAVRMLRRASHLGVGAIDTAPGYGDAELTIGMAATSLDVFTKIDGTSDPVTSVRQSLLRLRRERIAGVYLHSPDAVLNDPGHLIERAKSLVGNTVGVLGASVYTAEQFDAALGDDRITTIQVPVSAADRRLVDRIREAGRLGKQVHARSAFLQGALVLPPERLPVALGSLGAIVRELSALASSVGLSLPQLLVGYVRDLPGVTGVILGAERVDQLLANVAAMNGPALPLAVRARIDVLTMPEADVLDPRRWHDPAPLVDVDSPAWAGGEAIRGG